MLKKNILLICGLLSSFIGFAQSDPSNWSHKGPFKTGTGTYEAGRLDVIVLHPSYNGGTNQTIYAGGCNGGLWKTTNDGQNWYNVSTNDMKYSGVGDMAFTSDGSYLYVADRTASGTYGDRGSGVYKYTISGGTWTPAGVSSLAGLLTVGVQLKNNHLKIHPGDNSTLYLATNDGLFVTTNGGSTWTRNATGNFENIAFVPNSGATGLYDVFVSGMNTILKSSNKGATFSSLPAPSPNNPFTSYISPYFDVVYGGLDTDGTSHILYFYAWVPPTSTVFPKSILYKYKIPTIGSPTLTFLHEYQGTDASGKKGLIPEIDRVFVAGDKHMVYIGGSTLVKYKISNNSIYDPLAGTDVNLGTTGYPNYYSGSVFHPDVHDVKIYDNGTTVRKLFVAHDGGFSINTYTGTNGVYSNSWSLRNEGLHIATVAGFSGSETDPDVYATGEQDTKGFMFNESMSKIVSFGVEPRMVMIDRVNKKNGSGQDIFRLFHNFQLQDFSYRVSDVDFNPGTPSMNTVLTDFYNTNTSTFTPTTIANKYTPEHKVFYQDPNRANRIYGFSGGLYQWDESTQKFLAKYKFGKFLSNPNQVMKDHPYQRANSLAVGRTNKNKLYMASNADEDIYASHIYRYTGTDIDDSWDGHNDLVWDRITPDLEAAPFNYSLTDAELAYITYKDVCISDWDENKIFVIATGPNFSTIPNHANTKVLMYDNGVWSNYSTGIGADESPQTMIYERGSNDALYLATERNIYYRNASSVSGWEVYNANVVPHIFIRQMEINYKENTVRVGTYGRGIWKSNLRCPTVAFTANPCNNCNTGPVKFWEGTTVSIANTLLNTNKQVVRALTAIDIDVETIFDPQGNTSVYYELFIHGCGPGQPNTFRTYKDFEADTPEEEEKEMERGSASELQAYPNPNNGVFTLLTGNDEVKDVFVYDVLGKIVYQKNQTTAETVDIDIKTSPKGIYLVKVICDDKTQTLKIINQ